MTIATDGHFSVLISSRYRSNDGNLFHNLVTPHVGILSLCAALPIRWIVAVANSCAIPVQCSIGFMERDKVFLAQSKCASVTY